MKYCNYCGNPITEPARFCPKCGAQLQSDNVFVPIETVNPQPLVAAGPYTAAQQPASQSDSKSGPSKVVIGMICGAAVLVMLLIGSLLSSPKGITGTWKLNFDLSEMSSMLEAMGEDNSMFTAMGLDEMVIAMDLNQDNMMTISASMGGGSISAEMAITGTYEVLSDDTISLYFGEMTTSYSAFGIGENETEDIDETYEFNYQLDGNTLILSEDGTEVQFKRD